MDRDTAEPRVEAMPGPRAEEWRDYHQWIAAPSTHLYDFVWAIDEPATGPFCTDVDGNVLLDFTSHVAASPLGYNHPALRERLEAFDLVDPLKIAGQDFYASGGWPPDDPEFPGPTQLMDTLIEITEGMDTVFLSNSGAEAVENAIKVCYDYRDGAAYGITFQGAFHGRTLGALSLNRSKAVHRRDFPEIPGITAVPFCEDRTCTAETCTCGFFPAAGDSWLRRLLEPGQGAVDPDDVAYVIVEPIQGEGGYRIPSEAFMDELAAITTEYDVPLIADEIQSGMGRTGEWWASDHFAIEPDVIAVGKALRVGATVSRKTIFPEEKARISSTWGAGDILSSMVGTLTIQVIDDLDLRHNAVKRGAQLISRLEDAEIDHAVDIRGKGLMVAVEFDTKARRDAAMECSLERGLLTLPCGHQTLRLLPPLDVREREIEIGADLFIEAVGDGAVQSASPTRVTGDEAS